MRDRAAVWTGSLNITDDGFTLMENNVLEIESAALAGYYASDFEQLWEKQNFENTGNIKTAPITVMFGGPPATVRVMFSPGCGLAIDTEIARRVRAAAASCAHLQLADQFGNVDQRAQRCPSRKTSEGRWHL